MSESNLVLQQLNSLIPNASNVTVQHVVHHRSPRVNDDKKSEAATQNIQEQIKKLKKIPRVSVLLNFAESFLTPEFVATLDKKKSPIEVLWNFETDIKSSVPETFVDTYWNKVLTPFFAAVVEQAIGYVRTTNNLNVANLQLSDLISHPDLKPWFYKLVTCQLQFRPAFQQKSAARMAIAIDLAEKRQAIEFFEICKRVANDGLNETITDTYRYIIEEEQEVEEDELFDFAGP